jgi:hypothetical protein
MAGKPIEPKKKRTTFRLAEILETGEIKDEKFDTGQIDRSVSPTLSGGDVDARWDTAESSGEETAGGSTPTPDQDVVEEIGRAIGVTYHEGEPLRAGWKEEERDEHRWELDPASSEDYVERSHGSSPAEELLHMNHEHRERKK